jgi:hypothetical protein
MTFPDFLPHFSNLAELEEHPEIELEEHSEKGMEILQSTVGTTCTVPSQISSINSLIFSLAKHIFELSTLHTLKTKTFSSSLSLSSLPEREDVVS